jgi:hypothetical protein
MYQDGDHKTARDFGDLAALADAYGGAGAGAGARADLNGDGVVDDQDLQLGLAAFEH